MPVIHLITTRHIIPTNMAEEKEKPRAFTKRKTIVAKAIPDGMPRDNGKVMVLKVN